jgi:ribosome-associated protein
MKNHRAPFYSEPADAASETADDNAELHADEGPSKSARKRDMLALQKLGEALVALPPERLAKIAMPERLRDALLDAQRFTQHGAHRRQLQLVGKLMRDVDAAPLQAALDEIHGLSAAATLRQQRLERLRARLLEDDSVCTEIARDYPHADIQQLRQLRRAALKEAQQQKPPRAYRELFRALRALTETSPTATPSTDAANPATPDDPFEAD